MELEKSPLIFQPLTRRMKLFCISACVGFCLCISAQSLAAQSGRCSQSAVDKLEDASDGIRNWSKLHAFYRRYHVCNIDDASVANGVSESVVRILANHWDTLPEASKLFKQDSEFEKFALAGVNITDLTDDLNHIDKLAENQCPANLHILCQKILRSIRDNK